MDKKSLVMFVALICAVMCFACACASGENETTLDVAPQGEATAAPTAGAEESPLPEQTAATEENPFYQAIIAQYAQAAADGYYKDLAGTDGYDAAFGDMIASEYKTDPRQASYALVDIDGNGVDELVIAALDDGVACIYDIFTSNETGAVRPFDMDFGYRTNLKIFADGALEVIWSDSAFESGCDFYRIAADGVSAEVTDSFVATYSQENTGTFTHNGETQDEDAWNTLIAGLESGGEMSFEWIGIE